MHFLHERNPWTYRHGSEPALDFCLWILQMDGLQVPPFDQHPDGDGSLRALGLTPEDWRAWFLRSLDARTRKQDVEILRERLLNDYLREHNIANREELGRRYHAQQFGQGNEPPLPPMPEAFFLHASWQGSQTIGERLSELELRYRHEQSSSQIKDWEMNLQRAQYKAEKQSGVRLYDQLKVYASRLPSLDIYLASYPAPLDYLVPPQSIVITLQEGQPDVEEYQERLKAAVAELASRNTRSSHYTYGPFVGAYRRHPRSSVPHTPAPQQVPQLDDPVRQLVIEELAENNHMYGPVDFASVSFLREKHRPGWRLYELTFRELDGDEHRQVYLLQQRTDGSWQIQGGGSSTDMQTTWKEIFAPIHDHPLLFLGAQWTTFEGQDYLLDAHGQVIDNGFNVTRVRLVNQAGQTLEDRVEDHYVFFACDLQDRIQLPMQAELYNPDNQLVWQQTIPETGLPPWLKRRK